MCLDTGDACVQLDLPPRARRALQCGADGRAHLLPAAPPRRRPTASRRTPLPLWRCTPRQDRAEARHADTRSCTASCTTARSSTMDGSPSPGTAYSVEEGLAVVVGPINTTERWRGKGLAPYALRLAMNSVIERGIGSCTSTPPRTTWPVNELSPSAALGIRSPCVSPGGPREAGWFASRPHPRLHGGWPAVDTAAANARWGRVPDRARRRDVRPPGFIPSAWAPAVVESRRMRRGGTLARSEEVIAMQARCGRSPARQRSMTRVGRLQVNSQTPCRGA